MDNRKILKECAENLALLTQLGLSLASPLLICLYVAYWLRERFSFGIWIMLAALLLGIGGGAVSAYRFWSWIRRRWDGKSPNNSGSGDPERLGGEEHQD